MNKPSEQGDFTALMGLVQASASVKDTFPYIAAHASQLRGEVEMFLGYARTNETRFYERLLAESLREYLDSQISLGTVEQAKDYVSGIHLDGSKAPWIVSLLQSIWHLKEDAPQAAPLPEKLADKAAVLVSLYNETRFCELALKSVRMHAGFPHCLIVVNNSTKDVSQFRQFVTEHGLADAWMDTGLTHHGLGLQKALGYLAKFRYVATLDSDAVGIKAGWLGSLIDKLTSADGAITGPLREPGQNTVIGQAIHPCCMVIDRKRIGNTFQLDFRSQWPFWDVGGLVTWDCKAHLLPIITVPHEYNGDCAECSTLIDRAVRHFWYTSRIVDLDDNEMLDGHRVADIRQRLETELAQPELRSIREFSAAANPPAITGGPTRLQYMPYLINRADRAKKVFEYLIQYGPQIRREVDLYRQYAASQGSSIYSRVLADALEEYFSSGLAFANYDEVTAYIWQATVEGDRIPWIVSLLQSLWHLKMDRNDIEWPSKYRDTVAVMVPIYNETRFTELCLKSIRMKAGCDHIVYAINNSTRDMSNFRRYVMSEGLADVWHDTGVTRHGDGLQVALDLVRDIRFIATVDSDAIGIKDGWVDELVRVPRTSDVAIIGPYRFPDKNTILAPTVHPSFMVIDQQRIGSTFQIDFRTQWPVWDAAALITWDCRLHGLPIVTVPHGNDGAKPPRSGLVNNSVRHFWTVSRVADFGGDETIDGRKISDIREHLELGYYLPDFDDIKLFSTRQQRTFESVKPEASVVLTTCNRPEMLKIVLEGFAEQTAPRSQWELIVVDDGSEPPVREMVESFSDRVNVRYIHQANAGLAAARNTGIRAASGSIILFHDDDDLPDSEVVAEHIRSHHENPDENIAVLGHWSWHKSLTITPLMHYITGPGGHYFGYDRMNHGTLYEPWKWWGGQISAKTSLLKSIEGPFDERFKYGYEDTDLVCRIVERGVKVLYNSNARKFVLRSMTFEDFCARRIKQGRALFHLAAKHPDLVRKRYGLAHVHEEYRRHYAQNLADLHAVEALLSADQDTIPEEKDPLGNNLYRIWARCFRGYLLKGYLEEEAAAHTGATKMGSTVALVGNNGDISGDLLAEEEHAEDGRMRIMVISPRLPRYDVGSSNVRVHHILKLFVEAGHSVELVYYSDTASDARYIKEWQHQLDVTRLPGDGATLIGHVHFAKRKPDIVWVTNLWDPNSLDSAYRFTKWVKETHPEIRVVIDTMDYHCKKYLRKYETSGNQTDMVLAQEFARLEKLAYPMADRIVTVTADEAENISSAIDGCQCSVIPNIHLPLEETPEFENRQHICFIGSLQINHNADAVKWFISEVWPVILREDPGTEFHVMGFNNGLFKEELEANPGVKVIGYVRNAEEAVSAYRVLVCPMLYGAGMKGKLGTAAAAGTPFVTTTVGAEGFEFRNGIDCYISDDAAEFARQCVTLMNDSCRWHELKSAMVNKFTAEYSPAAVGPRLEAILGSLLTGRPKAVALQPRGQHPRVAVITACHNCEDFLAESIESVLSQSMPDWELWLLDDHSTDATRTIIEKYAAMDKRITAVYFDDNRGPYVRRNYAIERTSADFVVVHDADDIMLPTKLERLCEEISADDNIGVVGHCYLSFTDEFREIRFAEATTHTLDVQEILERLLEHKTALVHGAAIIRKSLFDTIGLYDENFFASDSFFLEKAGLYWHHTGRMRIVNIADKLMLRRLHGRSQTGVMQTFDHRSRRKLFREVTSSLVDELGAKLKTTVSGDVSGLFKACRCPDFVTRYAEQIRQLESQILPEETLYGWARKAVDFFNKKEYASCLSRLAGTESICPELPKRLRNFSLLKAMTCYQLGLRTRCIEELKVEISNHNNPAAKQFAGDFFSTEDPPDIFLWCTRYDSLYDLRITETPAVGKEIHTMHTRAAELLARKDKVLVSVVIPAYNAEAFIQKTIVSVLAQSYDRFEIIVVNDGSTDGTCSRVTEIVDPRIRVVNKANGGASSARNEGIRRSSGECIICLDADDMMAMEYITRHVMLLEENPGADLAYCDQILINTDDVQRRRLDQPEYSTNDGLIRDMFRCGYPVIQPRGCMRRRMFERIGLYDESLVIGEDFDLMIRFIKAGLAAVHLPAALYLRRLRSDSLCGNMDQPKAESHFRVIDRILRDFDHTQLFPDVNWSTIPSDKVAASSKCLVGVTLLAMAKNYHAAGKPTSALQALDRAVSSLRESSVLDSSSTRPRGLLRECERLRRQIVLPAAAGEISETPQEGCSFDDNGKESLNRLSNIMGT